MILCRTKKILRIKAKTATTHFAAYIARKETAVKKCLGEKCSFYETSEEKLHSNDAWSKRMNALDSVKQTEIAKKYYGGKKPWKK